MTYAKNEIMTATDMVRNFSSVLGSLSKGENKRVVIVKNNRFEAVMITVDEYEKMSEAVQILEKIYASTKKKSDG
ncbi:MAG: type II toxin-antitoxin system Phd/YefM family antitoxin [Sulfurospirillum sp.]|jgi:PHD/YefM family antitoxin component YafN of YafNO toxin-antitoxin module|uniref:type II toxin-antitoxin system Phd/YefM family antitoxin n=1 Tax=Sulfurospirillum sp. UCH001 TaxID=1581011 RepID=UPI00083192E9|nr:MULTISPECIES: type II toxin-antitoxin system Phd/YefM family antitoxin [unclassified Sulfurospirillum]MBP1681750.1 Phd YefM antitoxin superfamily protein [Pseudomonadota bacterium]WNY98900.1 type II toxin-antitoxin system Phd/YefM family antitoxin [Sulfurospirillum sp. 'SP']